MAFTGSGIIGSSADKTAGSSQALTTTASAAVGDLIVVTVAKDNVATTDSASSNEITSVTDSAGNTYSKAGEYRNGGGAADAGTVAAVFYSRLTSALSSGGTITANFSASVTAAAILANKFTGLTGDVSVESVATAEATSNMSGMGLALSSLTSRDYLFFHGFGWENATSASTQFTASTGYTYDGWVSSSGGNAGTNQTAVSEWDVAAAATGSSINMILNSGAAADSAHLLVAFYEVAADPGAMTGSVTGFAFGAPTGTLAGAGALAGSAAMTFAPTGTLIGSAALSGSVAGFAFTATGTLIDAPAPSGAMSGSVTGFGFTAAGTLAGAGALAGSTAAAFATTATLSGLAPISGTVSGFAFSTTGAIGGTGALQGSAALVFSAAGALVGDGALQGSAAVAFALTGSAQAIGAIAGSTSMNFSLTGTLAAVDYSQTFYDLFGDTWTKRQILINKIIAQQRLLTVLEVTAGATISAIHVARGVTKTSNGAQGWLLPTHAADPLERGAMVTVTNRGDTTGDITVTPDTGVTLYRGGVSGAVVISPGNMVTFVKLADNIWQA